ncbi:MAG: hypothetical protein DMG36_05320 [Acidobacteria bacterium]|nr:MAG: hypothetical protein DMG36_05320 [Acidobacteriota bacterium]
MTTLKISGKWSFPHGLQGNRSLALLISSVVALLALLVRSSLSQGFPPRQLIFRYGVQYLNSVKPRGAL